MINPAYTLHALLERAYQISSDHSKYASTWMEVFQISDGDTKMSTDDRIALMESISSMLQLYVDTKILIEQNSKLNTLKNQKYLTAVGNAIYNINLEGNMLHFRNKINNETIMALSYIADSIGFIYDLNEHIIHSEDAETLLEDVDDLIITISKTELPNDSKLILIRNLNNIREALYKYKFLGADALKDALEQSLGSLFLNNQTLTEFSDEESFSRFYKVLERLNTLTSVGTSVKELALPFFSNIIK